MKANKAPEKVYLHLTTGSHILNGKYYEYKPAKIRFDDIIIEYAHKDVFIEKAKKYIANHFLAPGMDNEIKDFVNYMKGE